jgi:hypothetical protein
MSRPFLFLLRLNSIRRFDTTHSMGVALGFPSFDRLDFQHELWIRLFMMNQQARPARC